MSKFLGFLLMMFLLSSCGAKLVPVQTTDVTLDLKDNSLISQKGTYKLEVKIVPQSYAFYGMEDTFIIFNVKLENVSKEAVNIAPDDFILLDDKSHQVNTMLVQDVAKIVEQNLFYLIPYPYIGYYSEGQNYYEGRYLYNPGAPHAYSVSPKDLYIDAFPFGNVLPNAHIKGNIYFKKRLSEAKKINLKAVKYNNDFLFNFLFEVK